MMANILRDTLVYETDSEVSAKAIVANAVKGSPGEVTKHTIEKKEKKVKGETIAVRYKVTIQVDYAGMFEDLIGGTNENSEIIAD